MKNIDSTDKQNEKENEEVHVLFDEKIQNTGVSKEESDKPVEITEEEFFLECCRYNDIDGVKDVLECGVVKLNYQDKEKNSALRKI